MKQAGIYLIKERIGRGGMSVIYKARAPKTNSVVAVKMLQPRDTIFVDLVGEKRLREIFLGEAHVMAKIHHRHIAQIIDCDTKSETPFIVLNYFPQSLGSLMGDSTRVKVSKVMDIDMTCKYIRQALHGLEKLHTEDIIHRDIKPHNLMIDEDDQIKIIDFGLCLVHGKDTMALPGMQVGSPYYTSPEQERSPESVDNRSDLFSIGVIAYRMLTGRLVSHREGPIPPPSTFNDGLDDDWDDFLLTSIQENSDDRYQSAYEMRQQLEAVCARATNATDQSV